MNVTGLKCADLVSPTPGVFGPAVTITSMGGGTKLLRLHEHGCAGVLADGRLRDFDVPAGYDFAAYCSGEATRRGGDSVTPFQVNVPVVVDRVGVMPGHLRVRSFIRRHRHPGAPGRGGATMAKTSDAADSGKATHGNGRRWYHFRPKPRQRTDLLGFNSTWWMVVVWLIVIVLVVYPYPGW
jgi:hypothetical protein